MYLVHHQKLLRKYLSRIMYICLSILFKYVKIINKQIMCCLENSYNARTDWLPYLLTDLQKTIFWMSVKGRTGIHSHVSSSKLVEAS